MKMMRLQALAATAMAVFVLPMAASGSNLRAGPAPFKSHTLPQDNSTTAIVTALARAGPAPAPAPGPSPAPGPAGAPAPPLPPPIRPGVVVKVCESKPKLKGLFNMIKTIHYDKGMDEMLGKTFVVKVMDYGGVGIGAPDGTQGGTWYFPEACLKAWLGTSAAKEAPVAGKAYKAVGLPTRTELDIGTPGRHDAPWEYTIKGRNLMDPIAPPRNEHVDLEKTGQPLPPWRKVTQIVSVECMEKLHKNPSHLCKPEAYKDGPVTPTPTTEAPLSPAAAKLLKEKIKRLETTIDNLTPEEARTHEIEVPHASESGLTLGKAIAASNRQLPPANDPFKMRMGTEPSGARLTTAQGHGEAPHAKVSAEDKKMMDIGRVTPAPVDVVQNDKVRAKIRPEDAHPKHLNPAEAK